MDNTRDWSVMPSSERINKLPTHGLVNGVDPVVAYMNAVFPKDTRMARMGTTLAYSLASPLHYSTGTPSCYRPNEPGVCAICREAARLSVQHLTPKITRSVVKSIQRQFGVECELAHPGDD